MNKSVCLTHVAILDDDPSVRAALGRFLRASDMNVALYATDSEFFASLALKSPDCLILDLQMPGISGLDVLRRIRSSGYTLPVIVLTGSASPSVEADVLRSGARAVLGKPIDSNILLSTIEGAVCRQQGAA